LTEGLVSVIEQDRFLDLVQRLPELTAEEVRKINVVLDVATLESAARDTKGIF
jgi:2-methylcitrate dehydratase